MKKQSKKLNLQKEKVSKVQNSHTIVGGTNIDESNDPRNCCSIKNHTNTVDEVTG